MCILKIFLITVLFSIISLAQSLNISGIVHDTSGNPIYGAKVKLERNGASTVSKIDGSFIISGPVNTTTHIKPITIKSKSDFIVCNPVGRIISKPISSQWIPRFKVSVGTKLSSGNCPKKVAAVSTVINDVISVKKDTNDYIYYRQAIYNSDTSGIDIEMLPCSWTWRDYDGNLYQFVKISWIMVSTENLKCTHYNDGTPITFDTSRTGWNSSKSDGIGRYCYYNNTKNKDSIDLFGPLYNGCVAFSKNLLPSGYAIPSEMEWWNLYVGVKGLGYWCGSNKEYIAKSVSAKADWDTSSTDCAVGNNIMLNNRSGLGLLPGGVRVPSYRDQSIFREVGRCGNLWCRDTASISLSQKSIFFQPEFGTINTGDLSMGHSIRIVR